MSSRLPNLLARAQNCRHDIAHEKLTAAELAEIARHPELIVSKPSRWILTTAGEEMVRQAYPATTIDANRIYFLTRKLAGLDDVEVRQACAAAGHDYSASRIRGWRRHPTDRTYAVMSWEDLEAVLEAMIAYDQESPE